MVVGGHPRGNMRMRMRKVSWIQWNAGSGCEGIPAAARWDWRTGTKPTSGLRSYDAYLDGWTYATGDFFG